MNKHSLHSDLNEIIGVTLNLLGTERWLENGPALTEVTAATDKQYSL